MQSMQENESNLSLRKNLVMPNSDPRDIIVNPIQKTMTYSYNIVDNRYIYIYMSRVVRKPAFCICENKDAEQLCGKREADQRLRFRYTDNTIPPLFMSEISSL